METRAPTPVQLSPSLRLTLLGAGSWRLNLHMLHVYKSAAGSNFGYYSAGQTGTIISIGTDILL